jgi:hypothetical protein
MLQNGKLDSLFFPRLAKFGYQQKGKNDKHTLIGW